MFADVIHSPVTDSLAPEIKATSLFLKAGFIPSGESCRFIILRKKGKSLQRYAIQLVHKGVSLLLGWRGLRVKSHSWNGHLQDRWSETRLNGHPNWKRIAAANRDETQHLLHFIRGPVTWTGVGGVTLGFGAPHLP